MRNVVYDVQAHVWKAMNPEADQFETIFGNWSERKEDSMKNVAKALMIAAVLMVALFVAAMPASEAEAAPLSAAGMSTNAPDVSLPYVEDVNPCGGKKYVAVVTCASNGKAELKVTCGGKKVKVERLDERTWTVTLKKGKTYKMSVKANGSAWKSIKYGVC